MKPVILPYSLFILAISFSMSSCRAPQELVYKDFKNFSIEKLGFSNSEVKMDLIYYNPNNFGLQLKRTDLDIFIDGNYLGQTAQEFQVSIPKRADFTIPLMIKVDMKNVFKNAISSFFGQEVMVRIIGKVKVGKANVYKSFPVTYEGKQKFQVF